MDFFDYYLKRRTGLLIACLPPPLSGCDVSGDLDLALDPEDATLGFAYTDTLQVNG
jgi:hypothetical protein